MKESYRRLDVNSNHKDVLVHTRQSRMLARLVTSRDSPPESRYERLVVPNGFRDNSDGSLHRTTANCSSALNTGVSADGRRLCLGIFRSAVDVARTEKFQPIHECLVDAVAFKVMSGRDSFSQNLRAVVELLVRTQKLWDRENFAGNAVSVKLWKFHACDGC